MNIPLLLACISDVPHQEPVVQITYAGFPGWAYIAFLLAVFLGIGMEMKRRAKLAGAEV